MGELARMVAVLIGGRVREIKSDIKRVLRTLLGKSFVNKEVSKMARIPGSKDGAGKGRGMPGGGRRNQNPNPCKKGGPGRGKGGGRGGGKNR